MICKECQKKRIRDIIDGADKSLARFYKKYRTGSYTEES